jgi:hypothetical protein
VNDRVRVRLHVTSGIAGLVDASRAVLDVASTDAEDRRRPKMKGDADPLRCRHFKLDVDELSSAEYHLRQPLEWTRVACDLSITGRLQLCRVAARPTGAVFTPRG